MPPLAAVLPLLAQSPVIMTVPAPPPQYRPSGADQRPARARSRVRVGIVMRGAGRLLYEGDLWVGGRGPASWRETVQQSADPACSDMVPWEARSTETSVQIIALDRGDDAPLRYVVTARWQRAAEEMCGGARTVEVRDTLLLDDAAPRVLRGDGGLTVEIRRR